MTMTALPVLLLALVLVALVRDPRILRSRAAALLAAPWLLGFLTLAAVVLLDEWPAALFPRYLDPMLAPLALFAAWAWLRARMSAGVLLAFTAASSSVACAGWVYMAGAYYFTNVGSALGIHAA